MSKHKFLNPDTIAKPAGYTHVVEPAGPGRTIFISGQLGLDLDGKVVGAPGDFRAQAERTFVNLKNALASVGAGFEHVVKLNNYLIDIAHLGQFREVRDRFVNTAARRRARGRNLRPRPPRRADRGRGDRGGAGKRHGKARGQSHQGQKWKPCAAPTGSARGEAQGGATKTKVTSAMTGSSTAVAHMM